MRREREAGFAMMTVVMGIGALLFIILLVYQQATAEFRHAQRQRRADTVVIGAEAMLERYAAKLTIDPLYYRRFVDEAEMPRRCDDPASGSYGLVAQPAGAWFDDCTAWSYETPTGYYEHPLLEGRAEIDADNIGTLLSVQPVPTSGGVEITVVSRLDEFNTARAITAEVRPESIAEFAFLVEGDLRFGSGAVIRGKIYVGDDLNFALSPIQGRAYRDVFAEDRIGDESGYGPPVLMDGATAYDGAGEYSDIRDVYADPLAFDNFWDDLTLLHDVACGGGGLCLSRSENPSLGLSSTPTAWLLEPQVNGGAAQVRVSVAYSNTSTSCLTSEEWWWLNSQSASWTLLGTYDLPASGAVFVESHAVLGRPGAASIIKGGVTILAGTAGSRKNVVIGSDIVYHSGTAGTDVLGLIASDEIYVNPSSVGADGVLNIVGSYLTQGGSFHVARDCGSSGYPVLPTPGGYPTSTLNTSGSMALRQTGDVAAHFSPRNYGFDYRLEGLRPPLFPLMKDTWEYADWREEFLPCWARPAGSPGCP